MPTLHTCALVSLSILAGVYARLMLPCALAIVSQPQSGALAFRISLGRLAAASLRGAAAPVPVAHRYGAWCVLRVVSRAAGQRRVFVCSIGAPTWLAVAVALAWHGRGGLGRRGECL